MAGEKNEIGIFDAIYSLMEHEQRLQGAELSGQRIRALQAGNVDIFTQMTSQIAEVDLKLHFILQKRTAQKDEFEERGIAQPGLSMAEKLHEYMLTLSGGPLPTTPINAERDNAVRITALEPITRVEPRVEAGNGHELLPAAPVPGPEPLFSTAQPLPELEHVSAPRHIDLPLPEPIDPLAEFKRLVPEEPNWDISSRPFTQKLDSGQYPYGIRAARMALASLKYGKDLKRLNDKRSQAVQEAYSDGSNYATIAIAATDRAVDSFVNDFLIRRGKKLTKLPEETQETITRIKKDPILGPLSRSNIGREKLLGYATYGHSLRTLLLDGSPVTEEPDEEKRSSSPARSNTAKERISKSQEVKVPELGAQQLNTVETYLRIYIEKGGNLDMRRAVTMERYSDQIWAASTISDREREEVIGNKMGSVARERIAAEKKMAEAIALIDRGLKPSATMETLVRDVAEMLGVESVSLADTLDLLNKRVSPEQIRQKSGQGKDSPEIGSTVELGGKNDDPGAGVGEGEDGNGTRETQRNSEDIQPDEELAFYALLALSNESKDGLVYETVDEACAAAYADELGALSDPATRVARYELLVKQFPAAFNRSINKVEAARKRWVREEQPNLGSAMNWLDSQELDGERIYATRDSSTLRRIGGRQVNPRQYLRKTNSRVYNRNQRGSYSGS